MWRWTQPFSNRTEIPEQRKQDDSGIHPASPIPAGANGDTETCRQTDGQADRQNGLADKPITVLDDRQNDTNCGGYAEENHRNSHAPRSGKRRFDRISNLRRGWRVRILSHSVTSSQA